MNSKNDQNTKDLSSITEVSDEVYFKLEDQHGALVSVIVNDPETSRRIGEFLFRRPTDRELGFANKEIIKNENLIAYNDVIINGTLLNGKDVVDGNAWIRRALHDRVKSIITPYETSLGKRRVRKEADQNKK